MTYSQLKTVDTSLNQSQSLFKLPVIFAVVMAILFILFDIYNYLFPIGGYRMPLTYFINGIIGKLLISSLLYFFVGIIMFTAQKMHQFAIANFSKMVLIGVLYLVGFWGLSKGYIYLVTQLQVLLAMSYADMSSLIFVIALLLSIIKFLLLVGIIGLVCSVDQQGRQCYQLALSNHQGLFATLFTILFLIPLIVIVYSHMQGLIFGLLLNYFYESAVVIQIIVSVLIYLVTLIIVMIHFMIIFFSVKNCFQRQFTTIPMKLLFKSVGVAYLYLIVFGIITGIVFSLVSFIIVNNASGYQALQLMITISLISLIVFSVINIIATAILTRKAVRKYFTQ